MSNNDVSSVEENEPVETEREKLARMADEAEAHCVEYEDEDDVMPREMVELKYQMRRDAGKTTRMIYKPGRVIGNLKLLARMKYVRMGVRELGTYSGGEWLCRCLKCKQPCVVLYRWIYMGLLKGRCCGKPACDPRPRTMGRPVDLRHIGEEYGRFLILTWTATDGWECYCKTCEGRQYFRSLAQAAVVGTKLCGEVTTGVANCKKAES